MCILNSFTEVDILYFGCMELKILFVFHKKVKTPSCYFEKNLNTPLSFTLKKVFAPLHSAPALLYSKVFKPPRGKVDLKTCSYSQKSSLRLMPPFSSDFCRQEMNSRSVTCLLLSRQKRLPLVGRSPL